MVDTVHLTHGMRQVLLTQQRTAVQAGNTAENIAEGRRSVEPAATYQARDLSDRAARLLSLKDSMSQSLHAVETAARGLESLEQTIAQARSVTANARGGTAGERQAAAQLLDRIGREMDRIAADARHGGAALIDAPPHSHAVVINESGETLTLTGQPSDRTGLGIGQAAADYNNLATDADIDAALAKLDAARQSVRARQSAFATDATVLQTRQRFNEEIANTLQVGSDKLTAADLDEEAANHLALQVRSKLGGIAVNLIAEKNSAIVDLF